MRLAVVGSRAFSDPTEVYRMLDFYKPTVIVSGGACGVDSIAEQWAEEHEVSALIFKPNWKLYGKRAGAIRNAEIVSACEWLIAFWDGKSKGTKISIDLAKKKGKLLDIIYDKL